MASSPTRDPLVRTTNNSHSPPPRPLKVDQQLLPPPNHAASWPLPSYPDHYTIRRKTTYHDLPNLDSSESYPSKHDSLYDALIDDESSSNHLLQIFSPTGYQGLQQQQEQGHTPHRLSPITEQSSRATLLQKDANEATTASSHDKPNPHHPSEPSSHISPPSPHRLSRFTFPPLYRRHRLCSSRHRLSFSTSDVHPSSGSPLHGKSQTYLPILPAHLPHEPQDPPPYRAPTPPNLPSFGKPEACAYRLPPPASTASLLGPRLPPPSPDDPLAASSGAQGGAEPQHTTTTSRAQRLVQLGKRFVNPTAADVGAAVGPTGGGGGHVVPEDEDDSPEMREWRRQTRDLPRGCVMRGDDGTLVRGRWVPAASGHFGPSARQGTGRGPAAGGWGRMGGGGGGGGRGGVSGQGGAGGGSGRGRGSNRTRETRETRGGREERRKKTAAGHRKKVGDGVERWMRLWRRVRAVSMETVWGRIRIGTGGKKWDCCCGL